MEVYKTFDKDLNMYIFFNILSCVNRQIKKDMMSQAA